MKTKTIVSNLTQEDIVNLLSTASYGSFWCALDYDPKDYDSLENKSEWDSIEDKMAKILLAGKSVGIADFYADDDKDFYGKLPHEWDSEGESMNYTITLKDIEKGLAKAFDSSNGWVRECAHEYLEYEDSIDWDITMAETLMQVIIFGEQVYD